jgi:hypothetical protein
MAQEGCVIAAADELAALVATLVASGEDEAVSPDGWFIRSRPPSHDFNFEVLQAPEFPEGALKVMSDHDFWTVAFLPLRFRDLGCETVVRALWPDIANPVILPEHGDPWWDAVCDEDAEVPGFPFELWLVTPAQALRLDTFARLDEAEAAMAATRVSPAVGGMEWRLETRKWASGTRRVIEAASQAASDRPSAGSESDATFSPDAA